MIEQKWTYYFFLGIGGIGMSALARYLKFYGENVLGYDAVCSEITRDLEQQEIKVFYEDNPQLLPKYINSRNTLIILTPAIKKSHLLDYFRQNNFLIVKRAQFLGQIVNSQPLIAIAGTHGKTSTSAIIAHILLQNGLLKAGFIGGIVKPYNTNLLLPDIKPQKGYIVVEADEYDRSFLNLNPDITVITSVEPDHLDIYSDFSHIKDSFNQFLQQTKNKVIINNNVDLETPGNIESYIYGINSNADFFADNVMMKDAYQYFTLHLLGQNIKTYIRFPGKAYIENSVAAAAVAFLVGIDKQRIAYGLQTYQGTKRRFDLQFARNGRLIYDDYAHHPSEIKSLYQSATEAYPDKKLTIVFQPHLYSRTRDFAKEFAQALDNFDQVIVTDIYPAREKPIPGITPMTILEYMQNSNKKYVPKEELIQELSHTPFEVLFITGAGDINHIISDLNRMLDNG